MATSVNIAGGLNQYIGSEFIFVNLAVQAILKDSKSAGDTLSRNAAKLQSELQLADNPAQVLSYVQEMIQVIT
jgi:hypothetical protein